MPDTEPLDWRTEAHRQGLEPWQVWNTLRNNWPRNSMWNYPYSPQHIDQLAQDPTHHRTIRQAIHDTADAARENA